MSYACKGIINKDVFDGTVNTDRFVLNPKSRVIDNHNNYKLVMTLVTKNGMPVLNHYGEPLKVYEIVKYIRPKNQSAIFVKEISLPIYSYTKAIQQFETLRATMPATPWQEQYYTDRPHLFEKINGQWRRKSYEDKVEIAAPQPVAKSAPKKAKAPKIATPKKPKISEDKIRKIIDEAVKNKTDVELSNEELAYAAEYMDLDFSGLTRWRSKHPLTHEWILQY